MKKTITKVSKIKSWFSEKIKKKKINKPLTRLTKKKEISLKSMKLEMKKRHYKWQCSITKDHKRHYEQLHANKKDILGEMDYIIENYNFQRLNQ